MKLSILIPLLFLSSLSVWAQCPDYKNEVMNAENFILAANRNQKKVLKTAKLEEAQTLIDKTIIQIDLAIKAMNLAKEYASSCECEEGIYNAKNLYDAIFDYKILSQKIADSGTIEEIKESVKKNLEEGESIINEIAEASVVCREPIPDPDSVN
jgi:hypothetical protein